MTTTTTTTVVNRHDDHEANCFCCVHCYANYEADYSELTPGEGFTLGCRKDKFSQIGNYEVSEQSFHKAICKGCTCPDFEGRE